MSEDLKRFSEERIRSLENTLLELKTKQAKLESDIGRCDAQKEFLKLYGAQSVKVIIYFWDFFLLLFLFYYVFVFFLCREKEERNHRR
jgi:hypothetical protein